MGSLLVGLGSIGAGAIGKQQGLEGTVEGARTEANIERLGRESSERQFKKQISRQQPFVDVGKLALPQFIESISNRGDASNLPATNIQRDLISDFLGEQAPEFVLNEAIGNLEAVETERNKGRLSDLINIGLGGVGSSAGSSINLGTTLGQSIGRGGNLQSDALQESATGRQNIANQFGSSLAGLPAFLNAQQSGNDLTSRFSPQTTKTFDTNFGSRIGR